LGEKLLAPARHETSDVGPAFIWIGVPLVRLDSFEVDLDDCGPMVLLATADEV
jgi:hypothetical protein